VDRYADGRPDRREGGSTWEEGVTRLPSTLDLQKHAYELAAAFDARLVEDGRMRPEDACAISGVRIAIVSPIVDETTYAVALHELGHLIAPLGVLRTSVAGNPHNLMRDEEDAAWSWARHHALIWTPVMDRVAQWAEATYQQQPRRVDPVEPPVPDAPMQKIEWSDWK
jgi:hypothetical protein